MQLLDHIKKIKCSPFDHLQIFDFIAQGHYCLIELEYGRIIGNQNGDVLEGFPAEFLKCCTGSMTCQNSHVFFQPKVDTQAKDDGRNYNDVEDKKDGFDR